jgi:hypothetical protein
VSKVVDRGLLEPAPAAEARRPSADSGAGRYIRSFLFMRATIGALGVLLPVALVVLDRLAFDGDPFPRDSLSAYYYSGMREWFVVSLGTIGFFLIAYKITEKNLDNTLSALAGVAALTVPLFPTGRPDELVALTPLQELMGEEWTTGIHFGAAAVFICGCGVLSLFFGRREAERAPHDSSRSRTFWRNFHFACAGAIGLAVLWIVATAWIVEGPDWSLLAGETAATLAFGASWFMKGYEIRYLLGERT